MHIIEEWFNSMETNFTFVDPCEVDDGHEVFQ